MTSDPKNPDTAPHDGDTSGDLSDAFGTMTSPRNLQPLHVPTRKIIIYGLGAWVVALSIVLAIPQLRTGDRAWWPWACVAGIVLGGLGYLYVSRGRGNAADAE